MTYATHFDQNCVFCKIIHGDIPSFKIFEDDGVFAFMDINPIAPGHSLVIPKYHTPDLLSAPAETVSVTAAGIQRLAKAVQKTLRPDGLNILQANGPGAAQSVLHLHMHVVPRQMGDGLAMNWEMVPGDTQRIAQLAEEIKGNLD